MENFSVLGHKSRNIHDYFRLGKILGQGTFGATHVCTEIDTGIKYACKMIQKSKLISKEDVEDVRNEIQIMHHLSSARIANVVTIKGAYEDDSCVYIVVQLCSGGKLFDRPRPFSDRKAAELFRIIIEVVEACHEVGIIHRALKLENFMFASKDNDLSLTLIDFGLSVFFKPGQVFTDVVGSPLYVAPEVLLKRYGPEADVWSAGVILYRLLSGFPPFLEETQLEIFKAVRKGHIDFDSDSAKHLISMMLCLRPSERLTARQVLLHPWLCESENYGESSPGYQHFGRDGSDSDASLPESQKAYQHWGRDGSDSDVSLAESQKGYQHWGRDNGSDSDASLAESQRGYQHWGRDNGSDSDASLAESQKAYQHWGRDNGSDSDVVSPVSPVSPENVQKAYRQRASHNRLARQQNQNTVGNRRSFRRDERKEYGAGPDEYVTRLASEMKELRASLKSNNDECFKTADEALKTAKECLATRGEPKEVITEEQTRTVLKIGSLWLGLYSLKDLVFRRETRREITRTETV